MLVCAGYHSTPHTFALFQQPPTRLGVVVGDNAPSDSVRICEVRIVLQNFQEGLGLAQGVECL